MMDLKKNLLSVIKKTFGKKVLDSIVNNNELTIIVDQKNIISILQGLKNTPTLEFNQLIDLEYPKGAIQDKRFAVVYHLLSIKNNSRIRVRAFIDNNEFPVIETTTALWPAADWYEREAFDLFGIMFLDHPDLRRILTDYGFVGHPFRKDFPMIGKVEMRYDPSQKRVIYQPVTIEERNSVPRIVRDEGFHNG